MSTSNTAGTASEEPLPASRPRLSRTVIALGFVSLFTDMSSEMAYTQVPIFLRTVLGAPAWVVGLIEGIAESAASLLKLVSGWLSDRSGRRKPLTLVGYGLGALSKPLMALATVWPVVLALRFLDRVGKGLRTAPRDALIAESTPPAIRGRAFGLHRTMDTTGAVLGPLLGLWFLTHISPDLRHLFIFAGLPGLFAIATLAVLVREKAPNSLPENKPLTPGPFPQEQGKGNLPPAQAPPLRKGRGEFLPERLPSPAERSEGIQEEGPGVRGFGAHWRLLQPSYRRFLLIALLFNLGNSSDAFLVLRAQSLGFSGTAILALYAAFNVVEAALGYGAGILSDKVGRRPLIIAGWFVFAAVYLGFALARSHAAVVALFLLYGGYYTLTQGVQRAFAADLADPTQRATQIGAYHTMVGVAALPASLIAGRLFDWNPAAPFFLGAVTAVVSALLLLSQTVTQTSE